MNRSVSPTRPSPPAGLWLFGLSRRVFYNIEPTAWAGWGPFSAELVAKSACSHEILARTPALVRLPTWRGGHTSSGIRGSVPSSPWGQRKAVPWTAARSAPSSPSSILYLPGGRESCSPSHANRQGRDDRVWRQRPATRLVGCARGRCRRRRPDHARVAGEGWWFSRSSSSWPGPPLAGYSGRNRSPAPRARSRSDRARRRTVR